MKRKAARPPRTQTSPFEFRISDFLRISTLGFRISATAVALALTACVGPAPLKGGRASLSRSHAGIVQTLSQGDNPSQPTTQSQETIRTRLYAIPSSISIGSVSGINPLIQKSSYPAANPAKPEPNRSFLVSDREETRTKTELGAAQKDTSREFSAKLSSLRPITWVGVALLIFGLVSFAWPPLRVIIASTTTSAAITLGGLALIVLPTLVVGNEVLILGAVFLTVAAWFLAHRHGHLRGQLAASAPGPSPEPSTKN